MQIVSLKDNFAWIIKACLVHMRRIFQNVDCWILFLASSALNISRFHCNNKCGERRGKTSFWHVRPTKTQISLRILAVWYESSLSAWRNFASWAFQKRVQWRFWFAQADLNLRCAHNTKCTFSVVDACEKIEICLIVCVTYDTLGNNACGASVLPILRNNLTRLPLVDTKR